MRDARWIGSRWLGVGLAACLAVITLVLALTDRIALYINPESAWFAVVMAVVVLVGTVLSFVVPLGAEADHGHDHGADAAAHGAGDGAGDAHDHGAAPHLRPPAPEAILHRRRPAPVRIGRIATVSGGVLASGIVLGMLVLPPASLSAELAASRDVGAPPLFAGDDTVTLAATGDTTSFGVGDWASVFATATNPDAFDGDAVTLTGFVSGDADGGFDLSRLVITHCVIDAQPASLTVTSAQSVPATGQWVEITGTVRSSSTGELAIVAAEVTPIDEPQDPYEY
ncbi:TIGR03943 family protein [Microbacterium sp. cx-55]|uniref:TIGR03943 family putative permease subunit n=1 Tax=Microbacterium sp. cx-55 TaxID=2875948 RepID=UPI001CC12044|nr:TIGR03943 family protein [Microbacterium sp. cx-55]MBZ4488470.1 TIGR03943 family protein [Microbacterium sp. cx-55]UGB35113.1 TIGR03943 family protein [Microbacterium sp. cx-55]